MGGYLVTILDFPATIEVLYDFGSCFCSMPYSSEPFFMRNFFLKPRCKYLPLLLCGAASTCSTLAARAEEIAPVKVAPSFALPAPVKVAPQKDAPSQVGGKVGAIAAEANTVAVSSNPLRATAIAQLTAGTMSAQQLWDDGALKAGDVLAILESPNRLAPDERNEELQGDLAGLLVRQAPDTVKDVEKLPVLVRVALGRYYSRSGDGRTVELCEQLLSELDRKLAKNPQAQQWPEAWAVPLLGVYYKNQRQPKKEAQTWERGLNYQKDDASWQASLRLEAAQGYLKVDKTDKSGKAQALYAQVAQFGQTWWTSMAVFDQARNLMGNDQQKAARKLLLKALPDFENDKAQTMLLALLSRSFYIDGDLVQARRYSEAALELNKTVKWDKKYGQEKLLTMAREVVSEATTWQKSPIHVEPNVLQVELPKGRKEPIIKRLRVKTLSDVPLRVTSSSPAVQAQIISKLWGHAVDSNEGREVVVQIMPDATAKDVTLTFSSAKLAEIGAKVSVQLNVGN